MVIWSKNSSSLAVSEKLKFFNADELIEGTGGYSILRKPFPTKLLNGVPPTRPFGCIVHNAFWNSFGNL
jgi:hypothetical protein